MNKLETIKNAFLSIEDMDLDKLQKLLFYYQAWGLVLHEEDLLGVRFMAHIRGPLLLELEPEYISNRNPCKNTNGGRDGLLEVELDLIENVWNRYGGFSSEELIIKSKNEWPWKHGRVGYGKLAILAHNISIEETMYFYKQQYAKERVKKGELS